MKPSGMLHVIHVISVIVGFAGVALFVVLGGVSLFGSGGPDARVLGVTQVHALLCVGILILVATWLQVATIHHVMLERTG